MKNKASEIFKSGIKARLVSQKEVIDILLQKRSYSNEDNLLWQIYTQIIQNVNQLPDASQQLAEKDKEIERLKLSQIRQPLIWFADKMEEKLKKNDHKGGWDNCEIDWLIKRLEEETEELKNHYWKFTHENGRSAGEGFIIPSETVDIINECADVANFAMMIANKIESLNK